MLKLCGIVVTLFTVSCISASDNPALRQILVPAYKPATDALHKGNYSGALRNLLMNSDYNDSLLHDFKLAYVYYNLENYSTAITLFRKVIEQSPELIPAAYVYIAEIEQKLGRTANALAAYRTVLRHDIPQRFRGYIFEQLHALLQADTTISIKETPWLEEYFKWQPASREISADYTVDTLIMLCMRNKWQSVDSLLESTSLSGKTKCIFTAYAESTTVAPRIRVNNLFELARMAHACGKLEFAKNLFKRIKKRRRHLDTLSEKRFMRSYAELLYDSHAWKSSIRENKRYLARFGNNAEVYLEIARAYRKIRRSSQSAVWYDKLMKAYPRHPKTEEILWLRAWQHEDRGAYKEAAAYYKKIYSRRGRGSRIAESYIRRALCFYRMGMYSTALEVLDTFENRLPLSSFRNAGSYWRAKCLLAQKNTDDALLELRLLSYKEPFDYYAHRARQLLITLNDTARIAIDTTCSNSDVLAWLDSLSKLSSQKKYLTGNDSILLICGSFLALVGDVEKADFFIEPIELGFPGNLTLQYKLIHLYHSIGASAQAYRIARRLTWRIPVASRTELSLQIYRLFYPPFYSDFISKEAKQYPVDPHLISGIIRQESIFNPKIVSPAGAVGLMQIMPYTGKVLAKKIEIPFADDSLYHPQYNIRFGIYYVNELLEKYNGNPYLALSGYNAGPHNASRWEKQNRHKELDLFVEDIGYTETRGYVKKVMANYWTYQILDKYPSFDYGSK